MSSSNSTRSQAVISVCISCSHIPTASFTWFRTVHLARTSGECQWSIPTSTFCFLLHVILTGRRWCSDFQYVTASYSPQHCGAVRAADRDLFSNGQDAHISLLLVDEVGTSVPNSPLDIVKDLPFKMPEDLNRVLYEHCAGQATGSQSMYWALVSQCEVSLDIAVKYAVICCATRMPAQASWSISGCW